MKKTLSFLALSALCSCSTCFAELTFNYDTANQLYTATSERKIILQKNEEEKPTDTLTIILAKEYRFNNTKGRNQVMPDYFLKLYTEGSSSYELADNANYWQERNYTYAQVGKQQELQKQRTALEAEREKLRREQDNTPKGTVFSGKERLTELNTQIANLNTELKTYTKDRFDLKRNPSTLIYLDVINALSQQDNSKPLYDFIKPTAPEIAIDEEQEKETEQNLMDLELETNERLREQLDVQREREELAAAAGNDFQETEELRNRVLAREAEVKLAKAKASEARINARMEKRQPRIEQVMATREAFLKYQEEQKELMKGMLFTSTGTTRLKLKDPVFKKLTDSYQNDTPFFFEVKFVKGGANQRLWLQRDVLQELQQLISYDLYQDKQALELMAKAPKQ